MPGSQGMVGASSRQGAAERLAGRGRGNASLDRLALLAAKLLHAGSAQVTVLADVQHVAGAAGRAAEAVRAGGRTGALADSLCTVTVASGAPLVVADASVDARVSALPPVRSGAVGSYLGVPLVNDDGNPVGTLCVFDPAPRAWSDDDLALLEQLAGPVVAQLELAAVSEDYDTERVVRQLALDAAGVGAFDWDLRTGEVRWDDRLLELFGMDRQLFDGTVEGFLDALHPDDRPRVEQAIETALATCGDYAAEYRVVRPDGGVRWVAARGRALQGEDGSAVRLLGAAYDTTAVQEDEARVTRVLEAMPAAFFSLDDAWRFSYVNAEAERLLGRPREELVGGVLWELFPAAASSDFEHFYRQAVASQEPVTFDAFYPEPLDAWYEVRAWPSPEGLSVYFNDVTSRRAAQQMMEEGARRSAMLARVTAELTRTLDGEQAVGRLATLVVPELADWSVVTLVDDEVGGDWRRGLRDVGWWHADPRMRCVVDRYAARRIQALTDVSFVARALSSGEPVLAPDHAYRTVAAVLAPGEAQDTFRELAPWSGVVVPLTGRGRTVGLLTLFRGPERPGFSSDDLVTLQDVAARAGLALDNARLFAQQRELAEGLQRSMLTPPPKRDHLEVAVRYEPAAEVAQVGGDWYDSFVQRDGATVVVIGDVVGHDTAAAAAMGQLRSLLRGVAVHTGEGPADVLCGVDGLLDTLQVDTTATAVVARLEKPEGDVTVLRWSNAGHPPPLVVHADGRVEQLAGANADLLLGIHPDADRTESTFALERGATVLLYTDGLVERRGQSLDVGLGLLERTLGRLAADRRTLDDLCDEVLRRMLPERKDDDVALVAVRLHPES